MRAQLVNFFSKKIEPDGVKHRYNDAIEQYRGLCALMVMVTHGIVHADMLVDNLKWALFMDYLGAGYLSVIIFFCISGYVIGINYNNKVLNVKRYLKKRLIRLYPTYIISISLCVVVAGSFPVYMLIENLFFLQNNVPYANFRADQLVNYVTWSLNFEVVYYLAFIALFFAKPRVWVLLLGLLIISLSTLYCKLPYQFFGNYINGFYFWILGLFIGWNLIGGSNTNKSIPFLSLVFLHMCQHYLGLGEIILHTLGIYTTGNFNWVFDLPFALMVMSLLTTKSNAFLQFNKILTYALPGCVFAFLVLHHRLFEDIRWIMCLIYWLLALALYFEKKISGWLMEKFTGVGKISYALYLFHVPVAYLLKRTVFINDRTPEIIVKYLLWIGITIGLSILVELKLQPAIKRYFN